ncbi:MAG: DUF4974 domain-containing protein [Methylococcaceae bacterium]|nr:DUF4974 domain-containing protein [Methylococcaceae bacterium]
MFKLKQARTDKRLTEEAVEWFVRLQDENCNDDDWTLFSEWIAQSESHAQAYEEAQTLWHSLDSLKSLEVPSLDKARRKPSSSLQTAAKISALSLLLAVSGGLYYEQQLEFTSYSSSANQRHAITLNDGSQIDMNANTRLKVKLSLLQREIHLEQGEALFNVSHEWFRSFAVQTGDLEILDIGTRFNVIQREKSVEVSVLEGEVQLNDDQNIEDVSIRAGYSRHYYADSSLSPVTRIKPKTVTAWTKGLLIFDHTPLKKVVAEIERYHQLKFVFANRLLENETLSGTFKVTDLNGFLLALKTMLPITIQHQDKQTIVLQNR